MKSTRVNGTASSSRRRGTINVFSVVVGARRKCAPTAPFGRLRAALNLTVRRYVGHPSGHHDLDASPNCAVCGSNCRWSAALETLALGRDGDDCSWVRRDRLWFGLGAVCDVQNSRGAVRIYLCAPGWDWLTGHGRLPPDQALATEIDVLGRKTQSSDNLLQLNFLLRFPLGIRYCRNVLRSADICRRS